MLENHLAVFLMFSFALVIGASLILISALCGRVKKNPKKLEVYECGVPPSGTARERFSVKFYLVAIFFLIFDIEIVFLFPWAVVFKEQMLVGPLIIIEMFIFLTILLVGYIYVWKRGALDWT